jgi:CRISPR-associated protein Csh2
VFHITVNPKNIEEIAKAATHGGISTDDITRLKEALTRGVTALDSSRKIGSENEALLWVTLKADSTKHLPNFTELISVKIDAQNPEKRIIHCERVAEMLARVSGEIDSIELHYNPTTTSVAGLTGLTVQAFDIVSGQAITFLTTAFHKG